MKAPSIYTIDTNLTVFFIFSCSSFAVSVRILSFWSNILKDLPNVMAFFRVVIFLSLKMSIV